MDGAPHSPAHVGDVQARWGGGGELCRLPSTEHGCTVSGASSCCDAGCSRGQHGRRRSAWRRRRAQGCCTGRSRRFATADSPTVSSPRCGALSLRLDARDGRHASARCAAGEAARRPCTDGASGHERARPSMPQPQHPLPLTAAGCGCGGARGVRWPRRHRGGGSSDGLCARCSSARHWECGMPRLGWRVHASTGHFSYVRSPRWRRGRCGDFASSGCVHVHVRARVHVHVLVHVRLHVSCGMWNVECAVALMYMCRRPPMPSQAIESWDRRAAMRVARSARLQSTSDQIYRSRRRAALCSWLPNWRGHARQLSRARRWLRLAEGHHLLSCAGRACRRWRALLHSRRLALATASKPSPPVAVRDVRGRPTPMRPTPMRPPPPVATPQSASPSPPLARPELARLELARPGPHSVRGASRAEPSRAAPSAPCGVRGDRDLESCGLRGDRDLGPCGLRGATWEASLPGAGDRLRSLGAPHGGSGNGLSGGDLLDRIVVMHQLIKQPAQSPAAKSLALADTLPPPTRPFTLPRQPPPALPLTLPCPPTRPTASFSLSSCACASASSAAALYPSGGRRTVPACAPPRASTSAATSAEISAEISSRQTEGRGGSDGLSAHAFGIAAESLRVSLAAELLQSERAALDTRGSTA